MRYIHIVSKVTDTLKCTKIYKKYMKHQRYIYLIKLVSVRQESLLCMYGVRIFYSVINAKLLAPLRLSGYG